MPDISGVGQRRLERRQPGLDSVTPEQSLNVLEPGGAERKFGGQRYDETLLHGCRQIANSPGDPRPRLGLSWHRIELAALTESP